MSEAPTDDVRRYVRGLLERTDSFRSMPAEERRKIAGSLVKVMTFLTDPAAGVPGAPVQALAVGENDALKQRLADDPRLVGQDFKAGASTQGAQVFKNLVKAVDFPRFVSGLIEGVYSSIVQSSIQQMQAYGKLLEAVVKSVEDFAQENISLDSARTYVQQKFPRSVVYEAGQLRLRDDVEGADAAPDFKGVLGVDVGELNEDNEQAIVVAAQLKLARQRQQQLAMMVALGINRIVVTDGEIKASVMFDMKARDTAARGSQAGSYDAETQTASHRSGGIGWGNYDSSSSVDTKVSSAWSEEQENSTATLDAKAKLSGSVVVRFKSETFPLERLASPMELGAVQDKSSRAEKAAG